MDAALGAKSASFTVRGIPASKGSPKFGRNRRTGARMMIPQSQRLTVWAAQIAHAAHQAGVRFGPDVPVGVRLAFRLDGPNRGVDVEVYELPAGSASAHGVDLDKLCRAVFDALASGAMLSNDRQVGHLEARK